MTDNNLASDEALDALRAKLTPKSIGEFKFVPRDQGNYFCTSCFWKMLHYFAASAFVNVYISKNDHYCDNCGKQNVAHYRVIIPYYASTVAHNEMENVRQKTKYVYDDNLA